MFNARWKAFGNPVIVRFFHDVGYVNTKYPESDCTSWCAAALSWALQWSRLPIPKQPTSSQSFLFYGEPVCSPKVGDIAIFTDIHSPTQGHVGLFTDGDESTVEILGGNQATPQSGPTDCQAGYPQSKIMRRRYHRNPRGDAGVSAMFLNRLVRGVMA